MSNVVNIIPPTRIEEIVKMLREAKDTEELYVLRVSRTKDGERYLDWYTTASESKIWSVGALHFLAHKLMESGDE